MNNNLHSIHIYMAFKLAVFCRAMLHISAAYMPSSRRRAVSVTFVQYVETAKDTAIIAMKCK